METTQQPQLESERPCLDCTNGTRMSLGSSRECSTCMGKGTMSAPDFNAIFEAVTTTRKAAKGMRRFRQSAPEGWKKSTQGIDNRRAYYVWRMARFHGGADVTMPMVASLFCGKDAYRDELDAYADALAKKVFGTNLAGAHRWHNALGGNLNVKGLPDSAYSGGPVHDGNKPAIESEEKK